MIRRWLPVLLYLALVWGLSSRSAVPLPEPFPHFDKLAHLVEYAVLGALLARALDGRRRGVAIAAALALLWGLTDEVHQSFVPGRDASLGDLVADAAGACAGALAWDRLRKGLSDRRARGDA